MNPFRLALGTAIATWLLLLIGGLVNPMGASLACPDWYFVPTCNGELLPEMTGGVLYEHGHRLWASWVGLLTIAMAIAVWTKRRDDKRATTLTWVAVVLVALQGTLGGITVRLQLHSAVSTLHLGMAMVFFLLVTYLTLRLWPTPSGADRGVLPPAVPRGTVLLVGTLVFIQVLLGGLVRHLGAGLICGNDWMLCGPTMAWTKQPLAHLHMTHRLVGYLLVPAVLWASVVITRRARTSRRALARQVAPIPAVLVGGQVVLGLATVATGRSAWIVTFHTGVAALLLVTLFVAYWALGPEGARIERARRASEEHGDG